jgi:UDP-glucose 4-epimerase
MNILVTGANGFLGKRLLARLGTNKKDTVYACANHADTRLPNPFGSDYHLDITNPISIDKCVSNLNQIDTLIHLAAAVPKEKKDDNLKQMCAVNVQGTANLLYGLRKKKIKKIIYASTVEVYGMPQSPKPITELVAPNPVSYYGASKLAAENIVNIFAKELKITAFILRFSVMYGPLDPIKRAIPNFISEASQGNTLNVFGAGQLRDYLYVDDAVQAIMQSLKSGTSGTYNIGSGKQTSIRQAASEIIKRINNKVTIHSFPNKNRSFHMVLDIQKAKKFLYFSPHFAFPDKLEELIAS